eukprot:364235-Chlamydomonas_euryale.AAC.4
MPRCLLPAAPPARAAAAAAQLRCGRFKTVRTFRRCGGMRLLALACGGPRGPSRESGRGGGGGGFISSNPLTLRHRENPRESSLRRPRLERGCAAYKELGGAHRRDGPRSLTRRLLSCLPCDCLPRPLVHPLRQTPPPPSEARPRSNQATPARRAAAAVIMGAASHA